MNNLMSLGCQFGPRVIGSGSRWPFGGVTEVDMSKNCNVAGIYVTVPIAEITAVKLPPVVVAVKSCFVNNKMLESVLIEVGW